MACGALFPYLGAEFLPKLDEGAIAINVNRLPSVALSEAVKMTTSLEQIVREFPETDTVVSRIGRPEIATDPMGPNMGDTYVFLKPPAEWKTASSYAQGDLLELAKAADKAHDKILALRQTKS